MSELMHVGVGHEKGGHSGRYPYGSGENPYQHGDDFLTMYNSLKAKGLSEKEIADGLGMSVNEMKNRRKVARYQDTESKIAKIQELTAKGYSNVDIGKQFDPPLNESTVRMYKDMAKRESRDVAVKTADILMKNVDEKGYIDIGSGVELEMGVSKGKFETAVQIAKDKGYVVISDQKGLEQLTQKGQYTTIKVLAPEGTTWADVHYNTDKIKSIQDYSPDGGSTFQALQFPESISSNRVQIRYGDEGGSDKDGVIELRRGVADISLGQSSYAQVRIAVDGTHYMKGMAIYSDNLPDGVDILFNTNKASGTPKEKVFKELKVDKSTGDIDRDNPFGALIKANGQTHYTDADGNDRISVVNKIKEEGDWDHYSKNLSSQMLSKQKLQLVKQQLNLTYAEKEAEYNKIMSYTNPTIKRKLLISFADGCDEGAETLKAKFLPGQSSKVILPLTKIKDNEVYAPTYKNGDHVVLIRYPHGGTFEIPELVVNNNNVEGKKVIGNKSIDAIGINSSVAARLSGADFDGDTVVVIPVNDKVKITTSKPLEGLKGFNPSEAYPGYPGMKVMTSKQKGLEMGKVSNLITDMTLQGAKPDELARAVRHSMVVIDAEKHKLNYKQSEIDNGIDELKRNYQKQKNGKYGGAATLISKASSTENVNERKKVNYDSLKNINPETGEKIHEETGRLYFTAKVKDESGNSKSISVYEDKKNGGYYYMKKDSNGNKTKVSVSADIVTSHKATSESTKMAETNDAFTLSSGTQIEGAYANYANKLKVLANSARKESLSVEKTKTSASAKETYAKEVESLNAKLNLALMNSPRERQAQIIANAKVKAKVASNPELKEDKEQYKRLKQQELTKARTSVGANKKDVRVEISDAEWEAIQAGAVSSTKLMQILNNTDLDSVKERAMPRNSTELSSTQINRIKSMLDRGYTLAETAEMMGVSASTISKYQKEGV